MTIFEAASETEALGVDIDNATSILGMALDDMDSASNAPGMSYFQRYVPVLSGCVSLMRLAEKQLNHLAERLYDTALQECEEEEAEPESGEEAEA